MQNLIKKIIVPTRAQADTIIAVYLLKKYGENNFPGVLSAGIKLIPLVLLTN